MTQPSPAAALLPERIPVLIVAGFLGAGKTTFIRELLPRLAAGPRAPYVILNDFLDATIDASSLRGLGADVIGLAAGCVCCDDSASLEAAILRVPADIRPLIVIEANGTTDPYRLIEILTLTRSLRDVVGPILQLTVINEARWGKRLFPGDRHLERAQVRTASAILTNRGDKASAKQQTRVRDALHELNPGAPRLVQDAFIDLLLAETACGELPVPDTSQPMEHTHHHVAVRLELPRMTEDRLRAWLLSLPRDVQRVKGVVQTSAEEVCYFQRTDDPFEAPTLHRSLLPVGFVPCAVFIGHGLQQPYLLESLGEPAAVPEFRLA